MCHDTGKSLKCLCTLVKVVYIEAEIFDNFYLLILNLCKRNMT